MVIQIYRTTENKKVFLLVEEWRIEQPVTDRQKNIWKAIVTAYTDARTAKETLDKAGIDALFENYRTAANENKLTTIHDIAMLFFLGMFKWGE